MSEQIGISPKVTGAVSANLLIGIVLVIIGALTDETTITDLGLGIVAGAGIGGVAGYYSPPGEVAVEEIDPEDIEVSDELIDADVLTKLDNDQPDSEGTD